MKFVLLTFLISASAHAKLQNWKAQKRIELSSSEMAVDGATPITIKCPHQTRSVEGKLQIQKIAFEIACYNDYMGGFFHKDETLAQEESDAGETWQTQSLIFFDKDSKSLILSLKTYSTYETSVECDGMSREDLKKSGWTDQRIKECKSGFVKCKTSEKFKKWDSASQKFIESSFNGTAPKRQFKAFQKYLKNCN